MEREGTLLGNYRLTRLVGQGGFADVYLAEHLLLHTPAAIKVLRTRLLSESDMESFLHEARIIARLNHPHIVRVLDFGVDGAEDTPYLVMEFAEHGTLRQKYPEGSRLTLSTILPYVKQIAEALQYAHDAKLVHRDIKPENMLLGRNDDVLLSDFGVSLPARTSRSGNLAEAVGTVAYMAPEHIEGRPQPAGDQYALAIIIYEWLTGHLPFQGTISEICTQQLYRQVPSLRSQGVCVSEDVEMVLLTALAKDPKQRFSSVLEFAQTFERAFMQPTSLPGGSSPALVGVVSGSDATVNGSASSAPQAAGMSMLADIETFELPAISPPPQGDGKADEEQLRDVTTEDLKKPRTLPPKRLALMGALILLLVLSSVGFGLANAHNSGQGLKAHTQSIATATRSTRAPTQPGTAGAARSTPGTSHTTATPGRTGTVTVTPTATGPTSDLFTQITATPPTFHDTLSQQDSNGWYVDSECSFSSGHYSVQAPLLNAYGYCMGPSTSYTNFIYQAQVTLTADGCAGIIFRAVLPAFYYACVTENGTYKIYYSAQNGSSGTLLASGSTQALVTGLNQPNRVAVLVQGSKLALYLNGQYVSSMTDSRSGQGQIGMIVLPGLLTGAANFNNAEVWVL